MKRHFYDIKTVCRDMNEIDLTEAIKQHVLEHQVYNPPKNKSRTINQTNNYNALNNLIVQMDFSEKIDYLLEYQQIRLVEADDTFEKRFEYRVNRLEQDKFQDGYFLTQNDLIGLVDNATRINKDNLHKFNIFYCKTNKGFKIYQDSNWEYFTEEAGVKELGSLIKTYFLDSYELYLIKHLHSTDVRQFNRFKLEEHLEIYYQFISVFDLPPSICDQSDTELLGHCLIDGSDNFLGEKYMAVFFEQKKKLKKSEQSGIIKKIVGIIRDNTTQNISELNSVLMDLLKIDEEFREVIMESKQIKL